MKMRNGQLENDELWVRCIFCGDSQNDPEKAHFSVNIKSFVYHCLKCGAGGKLSTKQVFDLVSQLDLDHAFHLDLQGQKTEIEELELPELIPGAATHRFSALPRFHYRSGGPTTEVNMDAFQMRHPKDNLVTGVHLRGPEKHITYGDHGYGWVSPGPLLSSPDEPLRLVEGPYDVLEPCDVCFFGLLSSTHIHELTGHYLILCPDGDVWQKKALLRKMVRTIRTLLLAPYKAPVLIGVEYLPDGKDPDEIPAAERTYIERDDIFTFIKGLANMLEE